MNNADFMKHACASSVKRARALAHELLVNFKTTEFRQNNEPRGAEKP